MLKSFSTAVSFLTIIRMPFGASVLGPAQLAASFACFPIAGFLLGLIYFAPAFLLKGSVPAPLLSILVCAAMVIMTRGLHLDGVADLADGFWGGMTPERRLEIMKDSRIGAFGVLALIFAISLKIASIHGLLVTGRLEIILAAPVFGRFAMVAAAYGAGYARRQGLGKPFLENIRVQHLAFASAFFALCATPILGPAVTAGFLLPVLGSALILRFMSNRLLGGITGDVLGTVSETAEIVVLVLGACILS
ncbi:MAG: adenosylcobinamide-GDP ribazoletransferase [Syntrophobacteraceae bacterium]